MRKSSALSNPRRSSAAQVFHEIHRRLLEYSVDEVAVICQRYRARAVLKKKKSENNPSLF